MWKSAPVEIEVHRIKTMGKTRTNILVDDEIRRIFEATKGVHNLTLGDATDIGMRYILTRINQTSMVEAEIAKKKAESILISTEINTLESISQTLKGLPPIPVSIPINNSNGNSEKAEERREAVFTKMVSPKEVTATKGKIIIQPNINKIIQEWDSGDALVKWSWNTMIEKCGFKNKDEAVSWFDKKIRKLAEKQVQEQEVAPSI